MFKLASIFVALLIGSAFAAEPLTVRIDPRVELLSIVFRLAGNREYNMPNSTSPYSEEVEKQFGKFRDHPAVQMARKLRSEHSVSFDAVMSLAVHLADEPWNTKPRTPLNPRPARLESRWTTDDAAKFIDALASFARDSDFHAFVDKHADFYQKSAARLSDVVNQHDYVGWFDKFFGARPQATFIVILGLLNGGGNYGVNMQYPDGREEITPIIGVYKWDDQGLPVISDKDASTIAHEFCHSYTNALVDAHFDKLKNAGDTLFANHRAMMKQQAYSNGRTVLYESMVRGVVSYYIRSEYGVSEGAKQILSETMRGFEWTGDLVTLLIDYDQHRKDYANCEAFMPRIVTFFEDAARKDEGKYGK